MLIVLRLALNDFGKFTARALPRLTLCALLIIPLLYSSLYLYANADPYGNLQNLPVAVVNNDKGAPKNASSSSNSASTKLPQNMGEQVIDNLKKDGSFKWEVADKNDYEQRVVNGEYAFALIIGADFTENVYKLSNFEAIQTDMELLLNDANSYVIHEIAEQIEFRVTSEVSSVLSEQVIVLQLEGLATIRDSLVQAADGATELSDGLKEASSGVAQLDAGVQQFAAALVQLKSGLDELNTSVKALPSGIKQLKDGADQLKSGLDQVNSVTQQLGKYEATVNTAWNDIDSTIKSLINGSILTADIKKDLLDMVNTVDTQIGAIHSAVTEYVSGIDELDKGAGQLDDGIATLGKAGDQLLAGVQQLADGAGLLQSNFVQVTSAVSQLSSGLKQLTDGANELKDGLKSGVNQIPNLSTDDAQKFAEVVTNPVTFNTTTIAPAASYAVGLAPFFMALAGWIGVYILFVVMHPISTRALISNVAPWKVALGGWLPPAVIGIGQMLIMLGALHFIIDLTPVYTLLTVLFLFLMVLTYLTIVHFLVTAAGKVGLFLGLVLMIVQLTSSGGTFPWQTLPVIDQLFYLIMPMSHAVDALRNLLYGGSLDIVLQKSLVLVAYFIVFAVLDVLIVRLRRRWSMKYLFPAI
ncbi:MAG: YhgE/Pip domain-containing protein [Bifidobacteriaceae bacterium]|jgi:putative membrane protein|nr:YhgE/Pip domain-containing protein [Bifidobacteriaceae bacterium]